MAKDQGNDKPRRKPGRVPTSCAECRRLKLRCDKNVPCEKCVSRGCGSICPDGSLTTGKGNRLVLANTEQLHDRIEHLCSRIRQLETALKEVQALISNDPHPLLLPDLLQIKAPQSSLPKSTSTSHTNGDANGHCSSSSSSPSGSSPTTTSDDLLDDESFIDAFGTLTIGLNGESNFLGKTARSEYLIRVLSKPQSDSALVLPRVSKKVIESHCGDTAELDHELGMEVFSLLPPLSEATRLCEVYLETGRYAYTPVPRKELFDEILYAVYRTESFHSMSPDCHHKLALLFIVFALACLFDQEKHPYSVDAQEYYYLSKAAFGFSPMNQTTTLNGIQAMIHFCQYQDLADWESLGNNITWTALGMGVRAGQSIGLHLNSARWKLNEDYAQRRGRVFWQLYTSDAWQSFQFGRPPILSSQYIDCPLPTDTEEIIHPDGSRESGFHSWLWQYTSLVHIVMSTAFGSKIPSYNVVLELDKKIRDFPVPQGLQACGHTEDEGSIHYMQRWLVLMYKETVLLHLHRAYFAQALQDQPQDLTRHRYLPSVMSTYRSAWRMIQGLRMVRINSAALSARVNLVWSHALSGAIAMCILVTRAPTSKMTKPSLAELDTVAGLFEDAAPTCRPAGNLLDTVLSLKKKAHDAVEVGVGNGHDAELDRIGGKTHLISTDLASHATAPNQPSPPSVPHVHPTITADMRVLDDMAFDLTPNLFDIATDAAYSGGMEGMFVDGVGAGGAGYGQGQDGGMPSFNMGSPSGFGNLGGTVVGSPPILDATWQSFVEQLGF